MPIEPQYETEEEARQIRDRADAEAARLRRRRGWRVDAAHMVLVRTKELPYMEYPPEDQPNGYYPAILIHPESDALPGDAVEVEEEEDSQYYFGNLGATWIPPETDVFCWQVNGQFYTVYPGVAGMGGVFKRRCDCPEESYQVDVDCIPCKVMPKYWRVSVFQGTGTPSGGCPEAGCDDLLAMQQTEVRLAYVDEPNSCEWFGRGVHCAITNAEMNIRLYLGEGDYDDYWHVTIEDEDGCELLTVRKSFEDFNCCGVNSGWESVSGECEGFTVSLKPDQCTCCAAQACPPDNLTIHATVTNPEGDQNQYVDCPMVLMEGSYYSGGTGHRSGELSGVPITIEGDCCWTGLFGTIKRWESGWIAVGEGMQIFEYNCPGPEACSPPDPPEYPSRIESAYDEIPRWFWTKIRIDCAADGTLTVGCYTIVCTPTEAPPTGAPSSGTGCINLFESPILGCCGNYFFTCPDPNPLVEMWPKWGFSCELTVTNDDPTTFAASGECGNVEVA